jgi:hypothetical protein
MAPFFRPYSSGHAQQRHRHKLCDGRAREKPVPKPGDAASSRTCRPRPDATLADALPNVLVALQGWKMRNSRQQAHHRHPSWLRFRDLQLLILLSSYSTEQPSMRLYRSRSCVTEPGVLPSQTSVANVIGGLCEPPPYDALPTHLAQMPVTSTATDSAFEVDVEGCKPAVPALPAL